jgi:hypothetical protein
MRSIPSIRISQVASHRSVQTLAQEEKAVKSSRLVGVLLFVGALLLAVMPAAAQEGEPVDLCALLNDPMWDAVYFLGPVFASEGYFTAGDVITISATYPPVTALLASPLRQSHFSFTLEFDGAVVASSPIPGTLVYPVPASRLTPDQLSWQSQELHAQEVPLVWDVSCGWHDVGAGPGCDALIHIPNTAVVGAFLGDAPIYWAPGKLTNPLLTIPAGSTAWVLGVDESGQYYQIIWVCDLVWVPVGTMGPNSDAVWLSRPLPTSVVK